MPVSKNNRRNRSGKISRSHKEWKKHQNNKKNGVNIERQKDQITKEISL